METTNIMVHINIYMPEHIVINLNTAFIALTYYIAYEIATLNNLNEIELALNKLQNLIQISTDKDSIILYHDDNNGLAYYIMSGLKLKLEKELLYFD